MKSILKTFHTATHKLFRGCDVLFGRMFQLCEMSFQEFQQGKTYVRFLERRGHGRQKHGEMYGTRLLIADPFQQAFIAASVICLFLSPTAVYIFSATILPLAYALESPRNDRTFRTRQVHEVVRYDCSPAMRSPTIRRNCAV